MSELALMAVPHGIGELVQQGDSRGGDADFDDAAVFRPAFAMDPVPFFQAIEHAGHVRSAGDQPGAHHQDRHGAGMDAAEQAERVVLLGGQTVRGKELVLDPLEAVVGPPEMEVGFLFEGIEPAAGTGTGGGSGGVCHAHRGNRPGDACQPDGC